MNTDLTTQDLIAHTRELWNTGKKVMIQVAWNLAQIQKSDAWKGFKTFPQFCEDELGIGQSQTSKLLTIADYYLDKYSPEEIGPTDYEALYMATRLPGSVEENLAKAKTLKRSELRTAKQEAEPCTHDIKPTCVKCWSVDPKHEANGF